MELLLKLTGPLLAACFGAIFGSYATLFAYRLPRKESCFGRYFGPKSRCPNCNTIIKTRDLIPVINWLITLGRCRSCHVKIPRTHLFIELSSTLMFILCYLKFSFSEEFILYSLISIAAIILIVTDFTHKVLPNELLLFSLILSVAARVLTDHSIIDLIFSVAAAAILATIFYKIFSQNDQLQKPHGRVFEFIKFILIASVLLPLTSFIFYFIILNMLLGIVLLLNLEKKNISLAATIIAPFLVLMLCQPINL